MHTSWRDCKEWKDTGLGLSTTSNDAAKLYDAVLTQYVSWYDEPSVGGIEESCSKMLTSDPKFVMGHVLCNGLDLMGTGRSTQLDQEFAKSLQDMSILAESSNLTQREIKHVNAVKLWSDGFYADACNTWEDIMVENPLDMLAVKFAHDAYFYLGYQPQMRDSIARVLPHWKQEMPLYGYLMGMYSFGLCETNMFAKAEKVARKGLDINSRDAWSTHSMAHVLEMTGRHDDGVAFMSSTVNDWSPCGMLACHNFWHWAVYHIEKGEPSGAMDIFDSEIGPRCIKSGAMLDIVDASSMLTRLSFEGVPVGDRWREVYETCKPHQKDHILAFNDAHVLMSCFGANESKAANEMLDSLREYASSGCGTNCDVSKEVGLAICEAIAAYNNEEYDKAVDLMINKRYQIVKIGGSNAQRDVFSQFIIHCALKSSKKEHNTLARHLLVERKANRENSPLTDRLIARAVALHNAE
ncbi:unnamed protein product [Owenia fusiformis]|uniref:Tetratricopeptide repeat protein 38 n=1 Tax=Owenia fusiformis TaxID=6347 RepID=A0A8J1T845_OWEFU|nr:unnamed protein product [Owenia fusiformis]